MPNLEKTQSDDKAKFGAAQRAFCSRFRAVSKKSFHASRFAKNPNIIPTFDMWFLSLRKELKDSRRYQYTEINYMGVDCVYTFGDISKYSRGLICSVKIPLNILVKASKTSPEMSNLQIEPAVKQEVGLSRIIKIKTYEQGRAAGHLIADCLVKMFASKDYFQTVELLERMTFDNNYYKTVRHLKRYK